MRYDPEIPDERVSCPGAYSVLLSEISIDNRRETKDQDESVFDPCYQASHALICELKVVMI